MFLNMDLRLRIKPDILYYPKTTKPNYSCQYLSDLFASSS